MYVHRFDFILAKWASRKRRKVRQKIASHKLLPVFFFSPFLFRDALFTSPFCLPLVAFGQLKFCPFIASPRGNWTFWSAKNMTKNGLPNAQNRNCIRKTSPILEQPSIVINYASKFDCSTKTISSDHVNEWSENDGKRMISHLDNDC